MKPSVYFNKYIDSMALTLLILGVHGVMLLNDGIYWDDWLMYGAKRKVTGIAFLTILIRHSEGVAPQNNVVADF